MKVKILLTCIVLTVTGQIICLADVGDVNMDGFVNKADAEEIRDYKDHKRFPIYDSADINGDGVVDSQDKKDLIETEAKRKAADVNGDKVVDSEDFIYIVTTLARKKATDEDRDGDIDIDDYDLLLSTVDDDDICLKGDIAIDIDTGLTDGVVDLNDFAHLCGYVTGWIPYAKEQINLITSSLTTDNEINIHDLERLFHLRYSKQLDRRWFGDVIHDGYFNFEDIEEIRKYVEEGIYHPDMDLNLDKLLTQEDIDKGIAILTGTGLHFDPGDVNYDGDLNILDPSLLVYFFEYGSQADNVYHYVADVNQDGLITYADPVALIQKMVAKDESLGDVNADGTVDISDALLVAQYYVELIDEFPFMKILPDKLFDPPNNPESSSEGPDI